MIHGAQHIEARGAYRSVYLAWASTSFTPIPLLGRDTKVLHSGGKSDNASSVKSGEAFVVLATDERMCFTSVIWNQRMEERYEQRRNFS